LSIQRSNMAAKKAKKSKKSGSRAAVSKPKRKALAKPAKPTAKAKAKKPSSRAAAPKKPKTGVLKKLAKKKAAPRKTVAKKPKTGVLKKLAKKKAAPRKTVAKKQAAAARVTTFAERVESCDAGTEVWFTVAGGIEHAAIHGRGSEGSVVILTDAGVTEIVPVGNLFETADEARAARPL
jgi:hypothetical protein